MLNSLQKLENDFVFGSRREMLLKLLISIALYTKHFVVVFNDTEAPCILQ